MAADQRMSDQVRCGTDWPAVDGARLAVDLPRWPLIILAVWLLRRRGAIHIRPKQRTTP